MSKNKISPKEMTLNLISIIVGIYLVYNAIFRSGETYIRIIFGFAGLLLLYLSLKELKQKKT